MKTECVLELEGISKYFPGIKALDDINFKARRGEVHALIGENGAGKSTLVKVITGVHKPTSGEIKLNGNVMDFATVLDAQAVGITAIHQEASMFMELSVAENIYMGHHIKRGGKFSPLNWKEMKNKTKELLDKLELDIRPEALVKNLSVAQRHMVEIAKALSIDSDVIIMDEPTSALSLHEVEELYKIVRQLKKENKAIIFISHKFEEIFEICDYFTVMRDGKYVGEGSIKDSSIDVIVEMMVGRSLDQMYPKTEVKIGAPILQVDGLSRAGYFKDISFTLHRGEILGFFGLVGAGRSEVMRAIFGIDKYDRGTLSLNGIGIKIKDPAAAMKYKIAYIPEDRQSQGAVLKMNIRENITLALLDELCTFGVLNKKKENRISERYSKKMEVKAAGLKVDVDTLSGGNQQKVVLAKWLATEPDILILDEPTKGVDVGTKARVHEFISELASRGLAVILVSSELPEILGMSDNVIVMHEGVKTGEFTRKEADSETVIKAAVSEVVVS